MYVSVAWDLHHTFSLHNLTLMHSYRSRATTSFLQQSILYLYRLSRRVLLGPTVSRKKKLFWFSLVATLGPTVSRKKNCFGSVWLQHFCISTIFLLTYGLACVADRISRSAALFLAAELCEDWDFPSALPHAFCGGSAARKVPRAHESRQLRRLDTAICIWIVFLHFPWKFKANVIFPRPLAARFLRPNRRACSQANYHHENPSLNVALFLYGVFPVPPGQFYFGDRIWGERLGDRSQVIIFTKATG